MFLIRLIFYFAANLLALLILKKYVSGFDVIDYPFATLLNTAALFTVLNSLIRPLIKHFFTTFIIITLGLFTLIINAGLLLILDFTSKNITINGLGSLIYATLIISVINLLTGFIKWLLPSSK